MLYACHLQEEELAKRRDVDARLSDAQRDCETAHKARIVSEKQLSDVRSLAVSLEEQNRKLRNQASQKEAVLVRTHSNEDNRGCRTNFFVQMHLAHFCNT